MNQNVVFDFFRDRWLSGDVNFLSIGEVEEALRDKLNVCVVRSLVVKLYAWGYLDVEVEGVWRRRFRIKEKYVGLAADGLKSPLSSDLTMDEFRELGR